MTKEQRAAARARCAAATPGPWKRGLDSFVGIRINNRAYGGRGIPVLFRCQCEHDFGAMLPKQQREANIAFVAHARTDLPAALDEIGRLEALLLSHGIDPAAAATA
jgi:hypothetical protein